MKLILVPLLLFTSSTLMAFAWLGHIRFRKLPYVYALMASWVLVLPEYVLNITAIRYGHGTYSGGEMAAFQLSTGVICVAAVARYFLKERLSWPQRAGFALMTVAVMLVVYK